MKGSGPVEDGIALGVVRCTREAGKSRVVRSGLYGLEYIPAEDGINLLGLLPFSLKP